MILEHTVGGHPNSACTLLSAVDYDKTNRILSIRLRLQLSYNEIDYESFCTSCTGSAVPVNLSKIFIILSNVSGFK